MRTQCSGSKMVHTKEIQCILDGGPWRLVKYMRFSKGTYPNRGVPNGAADLDLDSSYRGEIHMAARQQPDIRAITRLIPADGNLVQGQSELAIDPRLARAANRIISASQNHYGPAEGVDELRRAIATKIAALNTLQVDPDARPLELLVTAGATGALVGIAQQYLRACTTLVFEPFYPYHRRIIEELGGATETVALRGPSLDFDPDSLRAEVKRLKKQALKPLRAIIVCSPANPTGKVFSETELHEIASICREYDLLCISDEVYEHYVIGEQPHVSMASLPGMWERTITVNSFSKSWNISGWRLGYVYGAGQLVGPLNNANNVFYVCSATPLQRALAEVLRSSEGYYGRLRERFRDKHRLATAVLNELGFEIYPSGSAFYVWARIPRSNGNAMELNESLIRQAQVAGVPGNAFAHNEEWDSYFRLCIAREDNVLQTAFQKIRTALTHGRPS